MEQILKYFPNLSVEQQQQFAALDALYRDWNAKINVISRKDIDNLYEHHVLHSLAKLIDGTGKKIRVAQEVCNAIGLKNCHPEHLRGEEEKGKYDFIVSRAVMPLPDLAKIVRKNIAKEQRNALPNGILCLKGGDLQAELQPYRRIVDSMELTQWFSEDWFKEKYVVYLPL